MNDSCKIDFIQIGANIGKAPNDPIWPLVTEQGWKGILVEPLPHCFKQLKDNYSNYDGLHFEMVAISRIDGYVDFRWGEHDNSQQASMFDSFHKNDHHIKVSSMRLETLCEKYNLIGVPFTLLQIDAEGADGLIIQHTDFARVLPEYIRFETIHIGKHYSQSPNLDDVRKHLKFFGYEVVNDKFDIPNPGYTGKPIDVLYRRKG